MTWAVLVAAPCWLAANALLSLAAWRAARRLLPDAPFDERLAASIVLGWACIVSTAFGLGLLGCLTGIPFLLGVCAFAVAALRITRHDPTDASAPDPFWIGLGCLFAGHAVVRGLWTFPTDWDSLSYHLPMVDHWLRAGALHIPDCGRWSDPGNNELLALWMVAPFSSDFLACLNNVPAVALFAASASAAGRCFGLTETGGRLFAVAACVNHVVLAQLVDAENDVAVAALFLATLVQALRHAADGSRSRLLLGAAGLGLLSGVKFYALGYAALALAGWLALARRRWLSVSAACACGCLLLGGYWYLRNWIVAGSPLYPREPFVHPDELARLYPAVGRSSFLGNGRPELPGLFLNAVWEMLGPLPWAAVILAPFSLGWLAITKRVALPLLTLGAALLLLITPFAVEDEPGTLNQMRWHYCPVRYGLCFLTLATLALAVAFANAWRAFPQLRRALILALAATAVGQVWKAHAREQADRIDAALLGTALFAACLLLRPVRGWAALLALLLAVPCLAGLEGAWHARHASFYDRLLGGDSVSFLERESPPGAVFVCDHRYYPYFGSRRQFRAVQPMHAPDAVRFLALLEEADAGTVVAAPRRPPSGWSTFAGAAPALALHPDRFRRVARSAGTVVYILRR